MLANQPLDHLGEADVLDLAEECATTDWVRRIGDYGPLTRTHHRTKTHTTWAVRQPFPRRTRRPPPPPVLHLHPQTEIQLEDYAAA